MDETHRKIARRLYLTQTVMYVAIIMVVLSVAAQLAQMLWYMRFDVC